MRTRFLSARRRAYLLPRLRIQRNSPVRTCVLSGSDVMRHRTGETGSPARLKWRYLGHKTAGERRPRPRFHRDRGRRDCSSIAANLPEISAGVEREGAHTGHDCRLVTLREPRGSERVDKWGGCASLILCERCLWRRRPTALSVSGIGTSEVIVTCDDKRAGRVMLEETRPSEA